MLFHCHDEGRILFLFCAIVLGTYGWMYEPKYDDIFTQSFSKSIWPNAAAAGMSVAEFYRERLLKRI